MDTSDVSHIGAKSTVLVRKLVDSQFPEWSRLPLSALNQVGTDNQIFRLGRDMCVRFPRVAWAAQTAAREQALLERFQVVGLEVPRPLGLGEPALGYPWQWSVVSWVEGRALGMRQLTEAETNRLAEAILAIRRTPADATFHYGNTNYGRGEPLAERNTLFQNAVERLADEYDVDTLRQVWSMCLEATSAQQTPVFLHGDLHGGNLVERGGTLAGLIDWGLAGVGDGACDLSAAWCLCDSDVRPIFRNAMNANEADWLRGAGWALSIACIYVAHYRGNPSVDCAMSQRTICSVLRALS